MDADKKLHLSRQEDDADGQLRAGGALRLREGAEGISRDRKCPTKQNTILEVASLFSILLPTLHITYDIVRGISKAESSNTALLVLVDLLYGTLELVGRRSGYVITLLVGILAALMPVKHVSGAHYPDIARSAGGFFFVWSLWALGGLGGVTVVLSAQGLWSLRSTQPK